MHVHQSYQVKDGIDIANYITMKISPFEKAIVSNIKDLILVMISVEWLLDFQITVISGFGIAICLAGSFIFSIPVLYDE